MTLSTTDSRFTYSGDAVTVAFSFPRKFISTSDLKVVLTDEGDGSEAVQTLNTHYTVSGAGLSNGAYATGTVPFVTAPGTDKKVIVYRAPSLVNETDFAAETNALTALNRKIDLIEMQLQRLDDARSRSIRLSEGFWSTFDATLPDVDSSEAVAGMVPVLASGLGSLTWGTPVAGGTVSAAMLPVVTAATVAQGAANLNTINAINVKSATYGATGDGTTDDTAAFAAAFLVGGDIFVPAGTYLTTAITMSVAKTRLILAPGATIKQAAAQSASHLRISATDCAVIGGRFNGNAANQTGTADFSTNFGIACIRINAASHRTRIEGVTIDDAWAWAVYGTQSTDCQVVNCVANTPRQVGFYFYDSCDRAQIIGNKVIASRHTGIGVQGQSASAGTGSERCIIANNIVDFYDTASIVATDLTGIASHNYCYYTVIDGNTVRGPAANGGAVQVLHISIGQNCDYSSMTGNTVEGILAGANDEGLELVGAQQCTVSGNTVKNCGMGMLFGGTASTAPGPRGSSITGNTFEACAVGVQIIDGGSSTNSTDTGLFVGNTFVDCTKGFFFNTGTYVSGAGTKISNNSFISSTLALGTYLAVDIGSGQVDDLIITDNEFIFKNAVAGAFYVEVNGLYNIVSNNKFKAGASTAATAIVFGAAAGSSIVANNTGHNYSQYIVDTSAGVGGNVVSGTLHTGAGASVTLHSTDARWQNAAIAPTDTAITTSDVVVYADASDSNKIKGRAVSSVLTDLAIPTVSSGTWTPVLTFATPGDVSVTYGQQLASYIRIGNVVVCHFSVQTSAFTHTTASGALLITGLPFTAASVGAGGVVGYGPISFTGVTKANYTDFVAVATPADTTVGFAASGSAQAAGSISATDTPTGGTVRIRSTLIYVAA